LRGAPADGLIDNQPGTIDLAIFRQLPDDDDIRADGLVAPQSCCQLGIRFGGRIERMQVRVLLKAGARQALPAQLLCRFSYLCWNLTSYNRADRDWAEWIAGVIDHNGYQPPPTPYKEPLRE
jgi:hypothetical protein